MRIERIQVRNVPPVKVFEVGDLSDVVVLAGPNGVGKTRLVQEMLSFFRNPTPGANVHLVLQATCSEERQDWGKDELDTQSGEDAQKLRTTLQKGRRRRKWRSSVINFESDRSVRKIAPLKFQWDFIDPWDEKVGWELTFQGLRDRFQDTQHSLLRKIQARRNLIASRAEGLMKEGASQMDLDFPDPTAPFREVFSQLLSPKEFLDVDPKRQELFYTYEGKEFPFSSLSSGELEVVRIIFDFLLRNPSDNIVLFDEPELHLHPELSYKLLRTLRQVGHNNQFWFCTHSPDIITASLDHSVVFIAPPKDADTNQAIPVQEEDETHQALKMLGHSIGIIALGRKIVLIEGENSSLDKQVYGAILKDRFLDLVLIPSGGKDLIRSFSVLCEKVIQRSIWGVEFFMLCDHDATLPGQSSEELETATNGRAQVLQRYHLENYFLDERVLAAIFKRMDPSQSWLVSEESIRERLEQIAQEMTPYAVALSISAYLRSQAGNIDTMPCGRQGVTAIEVASLLGKRAEEEIARLHSILERQNVEELVQKAFVAIERSLADGTDDWKRLIPGRPVFNRFASEARLGPGRLKQLYLAESEGLEANPFKDIIEIFKRFSNFGSE